MTYDNKNLDMHLQRIEEKLDKVIDSLNNAHIVQAEMMKDIAHIQKELAEKDKEIYQTSITAKETSKSINDNKSDIEKMKSTIEFQKKLGWSSFSAVAFVVGEWIWRNIVG